LLLLSHGVVDEPVVALILNLVILFLLLPQCCSLLLILLAFVEFGVTAEELVEDMHF